jgi:hypothetical protein
MKRTMTPLLCVVVAGFCASAEASLITRLASDNATIQNAGPRTGANGKAGYNMEGSNNGSFSSFGVADFNFSSLHFTGPVTSVTAAVLKLTQFNAAFSATTGVSVYLASDTTDSIQPTFSPFVDQNAFAPPPVDGLASVDPGLFNFAFDPSYLLGSGTYVKLANGAADNYTLTFTGAALTNILNALNTGGTLRLVTTADAATGAATYAGYTNSNPLLPGPTLSFVTDATVIPVPEPASAVLLGVTLIGLVGFRRSQRR